MLVKSYEKVNEALRKQVLSQDTKENNNQDEDENTKVNIKKEITKIGSKCNKIRAKNLNFIGHVKLVQLCEGNTKCKIIKYHLIMGFSPPVLNSALN